MCLGLQPNSSSYGLFMTTVNNLGLHHWKSQRGMVNGALLLQGQMHFNPTTYALPWTTEGLLITKQIIKNNLLGSNKTCLPKPACASDLKGMKGLSLNTTGSPWLGPGCTWTGRVTFPPWMKQKKPLLRKSDLCLKQQFAQTAVWIKHVGGRMLFLVPAHPNSGRRCSPPPPTYSAWLLLINKRPFQVEACQYL